MTSKLDCSLDFDSVDFRKNPQLYRIGKGEQGVLLIEPYKSEILQHWRFKTPEIARESSEKIYNLFLEYKRENDFVGMDMARKFLQMGITRARRYANHKSGLKYKTGTKEVLPIEEDKEKAESARIFSEKYYLVKNDPDYQSMLKEHRRKHENAD